MSQKKSEERALNYVATACYAFSLALCGVVAYAIVTLALPAFYNVGQGLHYTGMKVLAGRRRAHEDGAVDSGVGVSMRLESRAILSRRRSLRRCSAERCSNADGVPSGARLPESAVASAGSQAVRRGRREILRAFNSVGHAADSRSLCLSRRAATSRRRRGRSHSRPAPPSPGWSYSVDETTWAAACEHRRGASARGRRALTGGAATWARLGRRCAARCARCARSVRRPS